MKILAIDSSSLVASVAIGEEDRLLAEYTVDYKKTHSQTLLPMLEEVKSMIELDLATIDAIAVAAGPGSFTGLRIGSATAKGLAQALDKPIIEIPTMDGMAYQLYGCTDVICPMMDARRSQVYAGFYTFVREDAELAQANQKVDAGQGADAAAATPKDGAADYRFHVLAPQFVTDIHDVISRLNAFGRPVMLLGDGVPVQRDVLAAELSVPYTFAPAHCNRQHASALMALAFTYYKEGRLVAAKDHAPDYLRLSQAERERMEKHHATDCAHGAL